MNKNDIVEYSFGDIFETANLSEKQIKAIEYLAHGISIQRTAELCKISPQVLSEFARNNDEFRTALEIARQRVNRWHKDAAAGMSMLATERLYDILSLDYETASIADKKEIARVARFIYEINAKPSDGGGSGQTNNIFAPQVSISEQTADAIARRIKEIELEASGVPIVIEGEYSPRSAPASYACHADTNYGVLNYDEETEAYQCHLCGKWYANLDSHVEEKHKLSRREYNEVFKLGA